MIGPEVVCEDTVCDERDNPARFEATSKSSSPYALRISNQKRKPTAKTRDNSTPKKPGSNVLEQANEAVQMLKFKQRQRENHSNP
jgi:hypothetical protein